MLVLTRKKNERIRIAGNIEVTVLEIRGGKVRLGIECPPEIPVHREKILDRIQKEERELVSL